MFTEFEHIESDVSLIFQVWSSARVRKNDEYYQIFNLILINIVDLEKCCNIFSYFFAEICFDTADNEPFKFGKICQILAKLRCSVGLGTLRCKRCDIGFDIDHFSVAY